MGVKTIDSRSLAVSLSSFISYHRTIMRFAPFSDGFRNEFYRLLKARRSIRSFKSEPVSREILNRILDAAVTAPSGKNRQNWRFFVLTGAARDRYVTMNQKSWQGIKDVLQRRLKPSLYAFTERFFFTLGNAPVVIVAYSVNSSEERYHTSIGSVYMAVENLNLAATAEGLGCCTMGAALEIKDEIDRFLQIEKQPLESGESLELLCAVALGWPDHDPPQAPRQLEHRIQWIDRTGLSQSSTD